jgi:hypothetical protein
MRRSHATLATLALVLTACQSGTEPNPSLEALAATYVVTVPAGNIATPHGSLLFTTTESGVVTDHAAAGAEIRLVLARNGTTAGHLLIPDLPSEDGGALVDFEADLSGTWSRSGDVVTLKHSADTFLRDMPLTVHDEGLVGDRTFGGVRVRITLRRE